MEIDSPKEHGANDKGCNDFFIHLFQYLDFYIANRKRGNLLLIRNFYN